MIYANFGFVSHKSLVSVDVITRNYCILIHCARAHVCPHKSSCCGDCARRGAALSFRHLRHRHCKMDNLRIRALLLHAPPCPTAASSHTQSKVASLLHTGLSGSREVIDASTPGPRLFPCSFAWLSAPVRDNRLIPLMAGTPELRGQQGCAAHLPSPRRAPTTVAPSCSAAPFLPSVAWGSATAVAAGRAPLCPAATHPFRAPFARWRRSTPTSAGGCCPRTGRWRRG